jgi:hypothetical protein
MFNRKSRTIFFSSILLGSLLVIFGANAQEKSPRPPSRPAQEEEPVAITEKSKPVTNGPAVILTEDQFGGFRNPIINNRGDVAFVGLFSSAKSKDGLSNAVFIRSGDGKFIRLNDGEKASNLPEPIQEFVLSPEFNDHGDMTFLGSMEKESQKSASTLDPNDPIALTPIIKKQALFLRTATELKSLVRLGQEVPNMPSVFSGFSHFSTNTKGVTAFVGTYVEPDGRGLFLYEGGKLQLIVRSGQKLRADEEGTFSEHYYASRINERSEVAFHGRIADKSGIFISRPSGIEVIAMVSKPSPVLFTDSDGSKEEHPSGEKRRANYLGFGNRVPVINNKGEVAFVGFLDGPVSNRGLFFKGTGPAELLIRSGDPIPGTTNNFSDFYSPAINSRGEIAFLGNFGGRSRGVFIRTAKGIEQIAVNESPIPGGAKGEVFNNFTRPSINDRGEVVFLAQWKSPTTGVDVGIFMRDEKGVLKALVKRGDKMPK